MPAILVSRRTKRHLALVAALGAVVAMVPGAATAAAAPDSAERVVPVIEGLSGPRGLDVRPARRLIYTQDDGSLTETVLRGDGAGTTVLGSVGPPGFAPAVSQYDAKSAYILTGGGGPGASILDSGGTARGSATLSLWTKATGKIKPVADIAAYQKTDPDPYNQEGKKTESNPFGVASLADGSALVSDAAGNDLLHVWPDGSIVTVARLKPRVVLVPQELEGQEGIPPPGTPINAEGVATSVTVGADGAYYIGELRGFPATPGTSEVWRVEPDAEGAVCDPERPHKGDCQLYADGFTSIMDLAAGPDGEIYVLELCKQSWLQFELGIAAPIGALFRIDAPGAQPVELARNKLTLPGGVDVSNKGRPFVAGPVFGPGSIVRIR